MDPPPPNFITAISTDDCVLVDCDAVWMVRWATAIGRIGWHGDTSCHHS